MAPRLLKRRAHFSTMMAVLSLVTLSRGDAGDDGTSTRPLRREKRGWVWNQFFVLEEYAEDKPLYVGKVSTTDNCTTTDITLIHVYTYILLLIY